MARKSILEERQESFSRSTSYSDLTDQVGDFFWKVSVPPLCSLSLRGELRSLITTEAQRTQRTHRILFNLLPKERRDFPGIDRFPGQFTGRVVTTRKPDEVERKFVTARFVDRVAG